MIPLLGPIKHGDKENAVEAQLVADDASKLVALNQPKCIAMTI